MNGDEGLPATAEAAPEAKPEPAEEHSEAKVEFMPPEGFSIPESAGQTGEFDAVCTFQIKDGKVCLVKMGDAPMPGYGGEKSETKEAPLPSYDKMAGAIAGEGAQAGRY